LTITSIDLLAGIDGCRGGWIAAMMDAGELDWRHEARLDALLSPAPRRVFIDMPIGLAEAGPRTCEQLARNRLKHRKSSVFPIPVRDAIYASTYLDACAMNESRTGKRISKQAWNIAPKIRELDQLLEKRSYLERRLVEAHPELCFQRLNNDQPLTHNKHGSDGILERLAILERFTRATAHLEQGLQQFNRSAVQADDLLDALCLLVVARMPRSQHEQLPYPAPRDARGLRMRIVCARDESAHLGL